MNNNPDTTQFNLMQIILYHLLPGVPILLIAMLCANPTWGFGLPMYLSLMLAIMFGLIPTQLIILSLAARKGGVKIRDILGFTEKMPISKTALWVIPFLLFAVAVFSTISTIEHPIWTVFNWVPDWFRVSLSSFENVSRGMGWLMVILGVVFNGLLGPFVEEIYFRGFLLPRMKLFGKLAPLFNTVLFSLYHFFSPWENITRIIALTPLVYAVWYKKNIRIGIGAHCVANTLSMIGTAILIFS